MSDRRQKDAPRPPALWSWIVRRVAPTEMVGDLEERFAHRHRRRGARSARGWFRRQALHCLLRIGDLRPERTPAGGDGGLRTWWMDGVQALRGLVRAPTFTTTTVLVLGLGLGAVTTVFSVANWALLRPVPGVAEPERLVAIHMTPAGSDGGVVFPTSHVMVERLSERVEALAGVAAYTERELHLAPPSAREERARRVSAQVVTGNFFDVLGMSMQLGRGFLPEEGRDPGAAGVIVVSDRIWRSTFGAQPGLVGGEVLVNGRPVTVIGIAPPGFLGPEKPGGADAWMTLAAHEIVLPYYPAGMLEDARMTVFFNVIGRLAPGATVTTAADETTAAHAALAESLPGYPTSLRLEPMLEKGLGVLPSLRRNMERTVTVLLTVVGFLLLVTCANFANLLLAHGLRRRTALAIQAAIGASRARLVRQQVMAATSLAVAGGALGVLLSVWATGWMRGVRLVGWTAPLGDVGIDFRVAAFALGTALLTGMVFGFIPALVLTRRQESLATAGQTSIGGRRLRAGMMIVQLAVSFTLLVAALTSSVVLAGLRGADLGYEADGLLTFRIEPGLEGYSSEEQDALYAELVDRLREIPGVTQASASWLVPFGRGRNDVQVARLGEDPAEVGVASANDAVAPRYFATVGIPVVAGREFVGPADGSGEDENAVIVSESLARELFPQQSAVGRQVVLRWSPDTPRQIVGVVADARLRTPTEEGGAALYTPLQGSPWAALVIRTRAPGQVVEAAREVLGRLAPGLPVHDVATLRTRVEQRLSQPVLVSRLSSWFAALAVLLAGAGMYGVLAAGVAERRRELGVRSALGASASRLRTFVLGVGLRTAAVGLVAGALIARAVTPLLVTVLPGARTVEPTAWLGALVATLGLTLVASFVPVRRAGDLKPMEVLRDD